MQDPTHLIQKPVPAEQNRSGLAPSAHLGCPLWRQFVHGSHDVLEFGSGLSKIPVSPGTTVTLQDGFTTTASRPRCFLILRRTFSELAMTRSMTRMDCS